MLHQSHSQQFIKVKSKNDEINEKEYFPIKKINSLSPSSLFINYEFNKSNYNLSRNNKKNATILLCDDKTKYANFNIFNKREFAFHKSIDNNKKVFKYQNYSLFEEKGRTTMNINRKRIKKNIVNINFMNNKSLYLTDNIIKENKTMLPLINNEKTKIKFNVNKSFIDKEENKKDKKSNSSFIKIIKNNYFLNNIKAKNETERMSKSKEEKKRNENIDKKIDIFTRCNNKEMLKSKYIENMREYLFEKYNIKIKKEKSKILQENLKDKIESIDDKMKSLQYDYSCFNDRFVGKFAQYIKQIMQMKEIEKNKDNVYINYIFQLKKDIVSLNLKNKKIQNDRDALIRWMYLQICVKEKKTVLPKYYKLILEDKNDDNKEELKKIDKSLIENVLQYKNNIIFKDADLFLTQIKKYENQNIDLLIYFNTLREEISSLNKEKNLLVQHGDHQIDIEKTEEELYELKKKEILNLKNKYNKLLQNLNSVKSLIDNNNDKDDDEITKKHTKLYYKTNKILDNLNSYIYYDFEKAGLTQSYKNISEESLIVLNLTKIEIITDIFIEKNNSFKINFSDKMNNFQTLLDKNRKLKKNVEQRKNIKLKYERERDKIFKKYNKILILPTRKLNINNVLTKKLILKKIREQKKNKEENIDDYLYDLYNNENK